MFKRMMLAASLVALVLGSSVAFAQNPDQVVVDKSLLTPEQLAKVQTSNTMDQMVQVGQFAGVGKEIGEGMNGALSAITENTNKFANTRVGIYTMWLVAYKVVGNKAIRLVVGGLMLLVMFPTWVWLLRSNVVVRRVLSKEYYDESTKKRVKEYELYRPRGDEQAAYGLIGLVAMAILILFTAL